MHHSHTPGWYEIRLHGHLAPRWAARFDGMTLTTQDDGTTLIAGPLADQAALHGLLATLRDIGSRCSRSLGWNQRNLMHHLSHPGDRND